MLNLLYIFTLFFLWILDLGLELSEFSRKLQKSSKSINTWSWRVQSSLRKFIIFQAFKIFVLSWKQFFFLVFNWAQLSITFYQNHRSFLGNCSTGRFFLRTKFFRFPSISFDFLRFEAKHFFGTFWKFSWCVLVN